MGKFGFLRIFNLPLNLQTITNIKIIHFYLYFQKKSHTTIKIEMNIKIANKTTNTLRQIFNNYKISFTD